MGWPVRWGGRDGRREGESKRTNKVQTETQARISATELKRKPRNQYRFQNEIMYSKPFIGHTEQCPCGTGSQTTEHLLQSCPIYEPLRKGIWPDHTPVARKLYSGLGDLH